MGEGSYVVRGGGGGPSKRHLGPDPHLGVLNFRGGQRGLGHRILVPTFDSESCCQGALKGTELR